MNDGSIVTFGQVVTWLNDPLNWRGTKFTPGIGAQLGAHVEFALIALAISLIIAIPLGLAIGHTGRGTWLVSAANSLRALPTTGLLILLYLILAPALAGPGQAVFLIPTEIVLVVLAVPPILANTYAGIDGVVPDVRDAARGMGMTGSQILFRVELPNALPLMFSGLRSAALQVIATATVAATLGLGGLGRFVFDGIAQRDYAQTVGGAIIVALLAIVTDLLLAAIQRYTVSRGVSGRFRTRGPRGQRPHEDMASEDDSRTASVEKLEAVPSA